MSAAPPSPPVSHLGPFQLIRRLGQGGFAPVWLAEEAYNGKKCRDVAIKLFVLPTRLLRSPLEADQWREKIIEEARALCRVEHPNVVRFYSLQRDDVHNVIGMVMECVPGLSLDILLREKGLFEERKILDVGVSVAWALAAVHTAGLVHRDIKPGNIIQGASGYKLIDFGIVVDAPAGLPGAGDPIPLLVGTPGYIAPECAERGARPTPASDLYALGVTLFTLMNGRLPDVGEGAEKRSRSPASRRADHTREDSAKVASLAALIALLCEPDPLARPCHADWVARELVRIRDRLETTHTVPVGDAPAPAMSPAQDALLGFESRIPLPLAPFFAEAGRASRHEDATAAGRALGELGLAVLRYAFALGMAVLAAPRVTLSGALVEQLRSTARPTASSWCYLVRSLHEVLSSIDPTLARYLAFAADPQLAGRLGALLRSASWAVTTEESARWVASLLERAAPLLSIPVCVPVEDAATAEEKAGAKHDAQVDRGIAPVEGLGGPYVMLGDRPVPLLPWLPYERGQFLLPEAPVAPDKSWRATHPASGERVDAPRLDEAMRSLIKKDADTPREPCPDPSLVGRDDELAALERAAREAEQGGVHVVLLTGPLGIGRTRLLDAAVLRAGFGGERAIRTRCSPERRSPLRPLLRGLEALPDGGDDAFGLVKDAIDRALMPAVLPGGQRGNEALEGVEDALLWAAAESPVVLALDDIQWADAQTLGLLQLLVERAECGAKARLLVVATARDEPNPFPPLRTLLGKVRGKARSAVKHLALSPLAAEQIAALGQTVCPLDPELEQAVVRGSGGVPFFVLHALSVWRERGAIAWRNGAWHAVADRLLREDVPGVADLVEDRLASYFEPSSAAFRAAHAVLAAVALYGGGLGIETILRIGGEEMSLDSALEALVDAGILVVSGERQNYGFAQEMVRQAVLNLVRHKPWFYRLHRALLDVIAEGPSAEADAAFLAAGYEKLGAREKACVWLRRAMEGAASAGLFTEAAAFGDHLTALTADPEARIDVELSIVHALAQGRRFEEAKSRLTRLDARAGVLPAAGARALSQDLRRRILKLGVARGLSETGEDPTLVAGADALGDPVLCCEARMALAGMAPSARALELAGEAVALGERSGPALEFAARVLRVELCYAAGGRAVEQAERDLGRALGIAVATSSTWQQIHIEGDLAVLEAELGRVGAASERLSRLAEQAEARGMRGQLRLLCHNLSICLMREGRAKDAADTAKRTADLADEAGDPTLRAAALSLFSYALRHTGALEAALTSASEAEQLQRERDERRRAHTLLRRAEILDALGRADEAMADAQAARAIAEQHGDTWSVVTATLWEKFHLALRGEATREEVARALAETEKAGVARRVQTQSLIEQAAAWLMNSADPAR